MADLNPTDLYLELIKRCILGLIYQDRPAVAFNLSVEGGIDATPQAFDNTLREEGLDWPSQAHSMMGVKRMDNLRECVETALGDGVPGDLIETGVWRGGAVIFMRAVLKAHGVTDRAVWVADSFQGMPEVDAEQYPADADLATLKDWNAIIGVSREEVQRNFERYGLLDGQVRFIEGWFKDTLPGAPIESLAVMRLDGDLYESTMDALNALYHKLSPGGFCIIDDYVIPACQKAVHDYRDAQSVTDEIIPIDYSGAYWRRARP